MERERERDRERERERERQRERERKSFQESLFRMCMYVGSTVNIDRAGQYMENL